MSTSPPRASVGRAWGMRPALDGLRTIAVYLVLLFHAGARWFDGGFIGVDLFFVLSGFLVTTILLEELHARNRLDLLRFYERRVRRLLPAAVLLIVLVSVATVLLMSSVERDLFIADARAALLYYANWHFLVESRDYFGADTFDASPFLHFWSLSIEEQYYFFFPFLLWGAWRARRYIPFAVPTLLIVLFGWSLWQQISWADQDVNRAYYATSARLYQLLAGSLLAFALFRFRHAARASASGARWVGSAAVVGVGGLVLFGTSLIDVSPSARGLWATGFAVLAVGSVAGTQQHAVATMLGRRPWVYLGQISYGTYLWHWPVVVLLGQFVERSFGFIVVVAVLSTGFAAASYHFFERPIRIRRVSVARRLPVIATGLSASAVAAFVAVPVLLGSQIKPVVLPTVNSPEIGPANVTGPPPDVDYVEFSNTRGAPERVCTPDTMGECRLHTGEDGPTIWVMGDSQAREIEPALRHLAEEKGFNLWLSAIDGCPWPSGMVRVGAPQSRQQECAVLKSDLPAMLEKADVDLVMLIQQDRERALFSGQLGTEVGGSAVSDEAVPRLYRRTVNRALDEFSELGVRSLQLESAWLPLDDRDPVACLAGRRRIEKCAIRAPSGIVTVDRIYREQAKARADAFSVTISPLLCPARPVCDVVLDDIPVYRDPRHYSPPILDDYREQIWALIEKSGALEGLR